TRGNTISSTPTAGTGYDDAGSRPTPLPARDPSGLLEPGAGKLARPVLKGPRRSNASGLPDRDLRPRPNSRSPAATAAPPAPPPGYASAATSPPHASTASTS